jgi:hypothetical protein
MKRIGIRTHERHGFANAVGNPEVQHITKEGNRFAAPRCTKNDVAEPLNPGVGRLKGPIGRIIGGNIELQCRPRAWFGDARGSRDLP